MSEQNLKKLTHTSHWSRIKDVTIRIIPGILFLVGAFPVLFFNENRAVKKYQSLKDGVHSVVTVAPQALDQRDYGKLVHLTGMAKTEDILRDNELGLRLNAIALKRTVEMFQWKEHKTQKGGEADVRLTVYSYNMQWDEYLRKSSSFLRKASDDGVEYKNPSRMPLRSTTLYANTVNVGEYTLSHNLIKSINNFKDYNIPVDMQFPKIQGYSASLKQGYVYYGANYLKPKVGDIRVRFEIVSPQIVSTIAQQHNNNKLVPYTTSSGDQIELLHIGEHSAQKMLERESSSNNISTWVLRFCGFIMMLIGTSLLFRSLPVIAVAGLVTLTTIAIAWIMYRPFLALTLVVVGVAAVIIAIRQRPCRSREFI